MVDRKADKNDLTESFKEDNPSRKPPQIVRIEIEISPNKTNYLVGEYFDPTGMVVRAYFSNLTNMIATLYTFIPTGALTIYDTHITVEYLNKTAILPITVTSPISLISISIDQPPLKTAYFVGDYFESYGMVVKAYYSNGISETITDYTIIQNGQLGFNNTQITIYYQNKTAIQTITVSNPPPTGSFPIQTISGSNIGNNPFFNVFDQSIRFVSDAISVSRDSYALSFNLIYHSGMQDKLYSLNNGLPKRFKTNYHQYLVQDGADSNNNPIYKYIDAEGYIHSFYKISNELYYCCISNLFLTFYTENNNYFFRIVDQSKNEFHFLYDGKLSKIVDGYDPTNVKHIYYNLNGICQIYDERDVDTNIFYNYDNQNRLNSIDFVYRNSLIESIGLVYDINGFLVGINETANNNTRALYSFFYNTAFYSSSFDRVEYVKDHLGNVSYQFIYEFNHYSNTFVAKTLKTGYFDLQDTFIEKESIERTSYSLRNDGSSTVKEAIIKNHNNLCFLYSVDKKAHITASFESDSNGQTLKTLYKETGIHLPINGTQLVSINGHAFKQIPLNGETMVVISTNHLEFFNSYKHFVLRLYVRLNSYVGNRIKAVLSGSSITNESIDLSLDQTGSYQLIEIPFTRTIDEVTSLSLFLSFLNESYSALDLNIEIADVYLDKKERSQLLFMNGSYSFNDLTTLKLYDTINGNPRLINCSSYPYFSENDFLQTILFSKKCSSWDLGTSFVAFLSNGTNFDKYAACFLGVNQNNNAFIDPNHLSNSNLDANDCWYFLTESVDGKSQIKIYHRFETNYYEIITRTIDTINNSIISQITKRYSYINKLLKVINSHLENNVMLSSETNYVYQINGELRTVTMTDGNETIVVYDSFQNTNGYLDRTINGLNSVDVTYDGYGYLESSIIHNRFLNDGTIIHSGFKKVFDYDDYYNNMTKVYYKQSNVNKCINGLVYNYANKEMDFTLNNNPLYRLTGTIDNSSVVFKRYNGTNYETVLTTNKTNNSIQTIFHNEPSTNLLLTDNYDIYGKVINQYQNYDEKVIFNYETNIESSSVARLTSVVDKYLNDVGITSRITTYSYNSIQNSLSQINFDNGAFVIDIDSNGQTVYSFGEANSQSFLVSSGNNKVTYIIINPIVIPDNCEWVLTKRFDEYNRVSKTIFEKDSLALFITQNNYSSNGLLLNSFAFGCPLLSGENLDVIHYFESFNYDKYGNLSEASASYQYLTYSTSYTYDGFNRLIEETNNIVNDFNRTYSYSSNGRMEYFGNKYLSYNDNGQLESIDTITLTYDKYGNRLTKGNDIYAYERGKLLSTLTINNISITFKYDYLGRRYQKEYGNANQTKYYYHNNKLVSEVRSNGTKLVFLYDGNEIIGFCRCSLLGEQIFYYIKNPFGLIVGIANSQNTIVAKYVYDAWGNHVVYNVSDQIITSSNAHEIGIINPIRYKGYYYDQETGLYYLQSRYYDSTIGQFISPDDYSYLDIHSVSGYHLHIYCNNNPVMYRDPNGHFSFVAFLITVGIIAISAAIDASIGALAYWYWDAFGWSRTRVNETGQVENMKIINGFLLPGLFSKIVFLHTAREEGKTSKERSIIGQTVEWIGHNIFFYEAFAPVAFKDPFFTISLQILATYLFFARTKDVDLENSREWYKFWEHFL